MVNTWKKLQERQEKIEKEMGDLRVEVKEMKEMMGKLGKMGSVVENNKELRELNLRIRKRGGDRKGDGSEERSIWHRCMDYGYVSSGPAYRPACVAQGSHHKN